MIDEMSRIEKTPISHEQGEDSNLDSSRALSYQLGSIIDKNFCPIEVKLVINDCLRCVI